MEGKNEMVCKLKKYMYGLKQSLKMWYHKIDTYTMALGFTSKS